MLRRDVLARVLPAVALSWGFGSRVVRATAPDAQPILFSRHEPPAELPELWLAPPVEPGFSFTRLVASWNAATPGASRLRIEAQVTTRAGEQSPWYTLGVWAADDPSRTSLTGQRDSLAQVETDTLVARAEPFRSYRLRVRSERAAPDAVPTVRLLAAQVSDTSFTLGQPTSQPLLAEPLELAIAPLSQEVHARHYPQWGGGGEAWCSPTSTQMVVDYWGRGPAAADLTWVDPSDPDPRVDFAARGTYDAAYRGTGTGRSTPPTPRGMT